MRHRRARMANSCSDILSSSFVEVRRSSLTDQEGGGGTWIEFGGFKAVAVVSVSELVDV